jgi:hypothetical protein
MEVLARGDVELFRKSEVSLMPEDLEKQITEQELIDLFAYITLDRPPSDPDAKKLPGTPE